MQGVMISDLRQDEHLARLGTSEEFVTPTGESTAQVLNMHKLHS
jgi:hypothetical protein